jgi:hypothetical protein
MTNFLSRAASALRKAFVTDADTKRMLEKTYVEVALNSRFGGDTPRQTEMAAALPGAAIFLFH